MIGNERAFLTFLFFLVTKDDMNIRWTFILAVLTYLSVPSGASVKADVQDLRSYCRRLRVMLPYSRLVSCACPASESWSGESGM